MGCPHLKTGPRRVDDPAVSATDFAAPGTSKAPPRDGPDRDGSAVGPDVDHVIVRFGGGRYGICAPDVAEVIPVPVVTRLPGGPAWLMGICNWRGHVLPLVDLRPVLGLPVTPSPSSARVVVLAVDGVEVGLLAEAVTGLSPIPADCAPPPATVTGAATLLLRGLAGGGPGGPICVLDTASVLGLRDQAYRAGPHQPSRVVLGG